MILIEKQQLARLLLIVARNPYISSGAIDQLVNSFSDLPNTVTNDIQIDSTLPLWRFFQQQQQGPDIVDAGLLFLESMGVCALVQINQNTSAAAGIGVKEGKPSFSGGDLWSMDSNVPAAGNGVVLVSPNGTKYKISVDDSGNVITTLVP